MGNIFSLDDDIQRASRLADQKIATVLASAIALCYLCTLSSHGISSRPNPRTVHGKLFALQFVIVSLWNGCLVGGYNGVMVVVLMMTFLAFLMFREIEEQNFVLSESIST